MDTQIYQQMMKELKELIDMKDEIILHRLDTIEDNQKELKQRLRGNLTTTEEKIEDLTHRVKDLEFHKKVSVWVASGISLLVGILLRSWIPDVVNWFK